MYLHRSTGSEHTSSRAYRPQNPFRKAFTNHSYIPPFYSHPLIFGGWRGGFEFFFCMYRRRSHYGGISDLSSSRPLVWGRLKIWKAPLARPSLVWSNIYIYKFYFYFFKLINYKIGSFEIPKAKVVLNLSNFKRCNKTKGNLR
jgi:hypothetical protein